MNQIHDVDPTAAQPYTPDTTRIFSGGPQAQVANFGSNGYIPQFQNDYIFQPQVASSPSFLANSPQSAELATSNGYNGTASPNCDFNRQPQAPRCQTQYQDNRQQLVQPSPLQPAHSPSPIIINRPQRNVQHLPNHNHSSSQNCSGCPHPGTVNSPSSLPSQQQPQPNYRGAVVRHTQPRHQAPTQLTLQRHHHHQQQQQQQQQLLLMQQQQQLQQQLLQQQQHLQLQPTLMQNVHDYMNLPQTQHSISPLNSQPSSDYQQQQIQHPPPTQQLRPSQQPSSRQHTLHLSIRASPQYNSSQPNPQPTQPPQPHLTHPLQFVPNRPIRPNILSRSASSSDRPQQIQESHQQPVQQQQQQPVQHQQPSPQPELTLASLLASQPQPQSQAISQSSPDRLPHQGINKACQFNGERLQPITAEFGCQTEFRIDNQLEKTAIAKPRMVDVSTMTNSIEEVASTSKPIEQSAKPTNPAKKNKLRPSPLKRKKTPKRSEQSKTKTPKIVSSDEDDQMIDVIE